jgi:general secretion pathway protein K
VILANLLRNNRGVALIITIMIVSLVVALSLQFSRTMFTHVASAGNVGHGLKALFAAKSGVSWGLAVLKEDDREFDSVKDDWANPDNMAMITAASKGILGGGGFELKIEDLSGKIPINLIVDEEKKIKNVFTRLLELEKFDLDTDKITKIVSFVMDWIDSSAEGDEDLNRHPFEDGEDSYYMGLEKPYHCKNGPLDTPEELLLVKGITPEIFYGTEEKPGIGKYLGVYGKGDAKINANTADPDVLEALSNDFDLAGARDDATDAELETGEWYKDKTVEGFESLISTASEHFQIKSTGQFRDIKKTVVAVVKRDKDKGEIRTLSWKIE